MLVNCTALSSITLPTSWGSVTNTTGMFQGCNSLTQVTLPSSWGSVTNVSAMFTMCNSLIQITLPSSWGSITTVSSMFSNCYFLQSVILPTTWGTSLTNVNTMFQGCYNLPSIILPTSWNNVTDCSSMFYTCYALHKITLPSSWGSITTTMQMFYNCQSLYSVTLPASFGASITTMSYMFNSCYVLQPNSNFQYLGSNVIQTNDDGVIGNCELITTATFGALLSKIGVSADNSTYTNKLTSLRLTNASSTFGGTSPQVNLQYCALAAADLDILFGDLPTVGGAGSGTKTIKITGNPGVAGCTQTIATNKGWAVTTT
jgi:hypothetical protein